MKLHWTHGLVAVLATLLGIVVSIATGGTVPAPLVTEVAHVVLDPTVAPAPDATVTVAVDATVTGAD